MTYFLHVVKTCKANGGTFYRYPQSFVDYQSVLVDVVDGESNPK